jgi:histidyl-tRNA synthetase
MASAYRALEVGLVVLRINDRRILNGMLERLSPGASPAAVLRVLDKRDKQGADAVMAELTALGLAPPAAARLVEVTQPQADDERTFALLADAVRGSEVGERGLAHLAAVRALTLAAGVPAEMLRVDPSIARGLDYYTGLVLEAQLAALPAIGSVGSGGRYDDLAGLYTNTRLPGVGCSVGLDRLLVALAELEGGSAAASRSPAQVLVTHPGADALPRAFALAQALRDGGLAVEIYPEEKKHGAQMKYADRQGLRVALTRDADGSWHAKDLAQGATAQLPDAAAALAWVRSRA